VRTYSVDSKLQYWLVVFGVLWLGVAAQDPSVGAGGMWFGLVWLLVVAWSSGRFVAMPHTIEMPDGGPIRFVGIFRTSRVEPSAVVSVKGRAGFVEVRHSDGKVYLQQQFTGFHEFLTGLKQANPTIDIRGL
jgi:hypothetical protein